MKNIGIIDYGLSNLLSIYRAVEKISGKANIIEEASQISKADFLILPGVGAFPDGMAELEKRGLDMAIAEFAKSGKPFLGICLGMQMMLSKSEEIRPTNGLNLIEGVVSAIPNVTNSNKKLKIPHMSWNRIYPNESRISNKEKLFKISFNPYLYFVHSYFVQTEKMDETYSFSFLEDFRFASIINKDNLWGMQFHPEKSGKDGLKLLESFLLMETLA